MIYEKIDKNIIKKVETTESFIYLDKLEKEIENLEIEIKDMPNEMLVPTDKEQIENNLKDKQDLLKTLKLVK